MMTLKELRAEKQLTQQQVADLVGISLRSYISYENDVKKAGTFKYRYIVEKLEEINPIDEEHGILEIEFIKWKCAAVFKNYEVNFCYLFGSYVRGLKFYGLVEEIRSALHKKVDVLDLNQLRDNFELTKEILQDGIKIYG